LAQTEAEAGVQADSKKADSKPVTDTNGPVRHDNIAMTDDKDTA
jgi:hypothetical protein